MLALPLSQTVLDSLIQRWLRSRSHRVSWNGKDSGPLGIAPEGVVFAKAATRRMTAASALTASTNPSLVVPIPNVSVVCKLTYTVVVSRATTSEHWEIIKTVFITRYKRCDQIEERKARRLSGRTAPKGSFPTGTCKIHGILIVPQAQGIHILLICYC